MSKINVRGKDKDIGEVKSEKPNAHWTIMDKKLFLDLALEQKHKGNQSGEAFNELDRRT